jgi:hypothetical protein
MPYRGNMACSDLAYVLVVGGSEEDQTKVVGMFNCNIGHLPMKYLGVWVSDRHMACSDLAYVYQKVREKITNLAKCRVVLRWKSHSYSILPELYTKLQYGGVLVTRGDLPKNGFC